MHPEHTERSVELRPDVYERLERRVDATDFDSVDEYVEFAMAEMLLHLEPVDENRDRGDEEAAVKERLKSLGYID